MPTPAKLTQLTILAILAGWAFSYTPILHAKEYCGRTFSTYINFRYLESTGSCGTGRTYLADEQAFYNYLDTQIGLKKNDTSDYPYYCLDWTTTYSMNITESNTKSCIDPSFSPFTPEDALAILEHSYMITSPDGGLTEEEMEIIVDAIMLLGFVVSFGLGFVAGQQR